MGLDHAYGFDPGDSTGVAILHIFPPPLLLTVNQDSLLKILQVPVTSVKSVVFYESFVSRSTMVSRTQLGPQNIGAIKLWARANKFEATEISPSQTHRLSRKDVKAAGWSWETEHELDAIRVLIIGVLTLSTKE